MNKTVVGCYSSKRIHSRVLWRRNLSEVVYYLITAWNSSTRCFRMKKWRRRRGGDVLGNVMQRIVNVSTGRCAASAGAADPAERGDPGPGARDQGEEWRSQPVKRTQQRRSAQNQRAGTQHQQAQEGQCRCCFQGERASTTYRSRISRPHTHTLSLSALSLSPSLPVLIRCLTTLKQRSFQVMQPGMLSTQ